MRKYSILVLSDKEVDEINIKTLRGHAFLEGNTKKVLILYVHHKKVHDLIIKLSGFCYSADYASHVNKIAKTEIGAWENFRIATYGKKKSDRVFLCKDCFYVKTDEFINLCNFFVATDNAAAIHELRLNKLEAIKNSEKRLERDVCYYGPRLPEFVSALIIFIMENEEAIKTIIDPVGGLIREKKEAVNESKKD